MDTTCSSGVKFGDLNKEEHQKRLERNLKLAFLKQMEKVKTTGEKHYCSSPTWPSISSINPDGLDTSYSNGAGSLQVSRIGSEVVSSSKNLREKLPMHNNQYLIRRPMATSSVKKFPINDDKDRAIMPPPTFNNLKLQNVKRLPNADAQYNQQKLQHNNRNDFNSSDMHLQIPSGATNAAYQEDKHSGSNSDSQETKGVRMFSRWRILLNDQGQLIIKGTLECGKIARSKPVIQRLSSDKVQSIYKHTYILDGNITDDRNELPDYVRGKFHNGFPDDWENVYQLWRNYVAEGSPVTFRWPTPITDDDDDLHSEMTDFTYTKRMEYKQQSHFSKSASHATSSGYYSKVQSDCNQNIEKCHEVLPEEQNSNKKLEVSEHSSEIKDQNEHGNKNSTESSNNTSTSYSYSHIKNSSYLYEIIREDKIPLILSHLGDKNCTPQYLDKFIDLIDCLKYLLNYTPNLSNDTTKQPESPSKNQMQACDKCNTVSFSETQESNPEDRNKNAEHTGEAKDMVPRNLYLEYTKETSSPKKSRQTHLQPIPINSDNNLVSDSSDSEAYMGIPNVSLDRLIQSKPLRQRYRDRRNRSKDRKNCSKDRQSEKENLHFNGQGQQLNNQNDSSVSITEDEHERKMQTRLRKISTEQKKSLNTRKENDRENERIHQNPNEIMTKQNAVEVYKPKSPEISVTSEQVYEKQKPLIKSCEKVNYNLKFNHPLKNPTQPSDVSILDDDDVLVRKQKYPRLDKKVLNNHDVNNEQKLTDDVMMHPFLTYDSEDFIDEHEAHLQIQLPHNNINEIKKQSEVVERQKKQFEVTEKNKTKSKTESKKIKNDSSSKVIEKEEDKKREAEQKMTSSEQKRAASESRSVKTEPFGSKENPKILTSWVPCVMYEDEIKKRCCLKFEGKLLNEAGHVLNRKFMTDSIRQRHSTKIVETVSNEFYMLAGDFNDTKHVVPKELLKQCRTGCPLKIKAFCDEWRLLMPVVEKPATAKSENLHEMSIDSVSGPSSSRGRRIMPPLEYWMGERIKSKSNSSNILYEPGKMKENSIAIKADDSSKVLTMSEQRPRKTVKREENQRSKSSTKSSRASGKVSSTPQEETKLAKKRLAQKLNFSSDSDTERNGKPNARNSIKSKPAKEISAINIQSESLKHPVSAEPASGCNNRKLRSRQKVEHKENSGQFLDPNNIRSKAPRKKPSSGIQWTYQKGQQCHENILSDDQVSVSMK